MNQCSMNQCSIGKTLAEPCHVISTNSKTVGFLNVNDLEVDDQLLLSLRTGVNLDTIDNGTVCFHHERQFLRQYENNQKYCIDPFRRHKKRITSKFIKFSFFTCFIDYLILLI
jgi:hypothetical protein